MRRLDLGKNILFNEKKVHLNFEQHQPWTPFFATFLHEEKKMWKFESLEHKIVKKRAKNWGLSRGWGGLPYLKHREV